MNQVIRNEIFERLQAHNPHPKTELIFASNYELLIAVMLSAQSTDKQVNKITKPLFKVANTPAAMLELGHARLIEMIKSIGLFNSKAKHIISASKRLLDHFDGIVPDKLEALESLPGVGRKTANVVLNCAFGQLTMPVDTHVFRVANRTGLARGTTPLAIEKKLLKNIAKSYLNYAHHWLILHGRYICLARRPACENCLIRDLCEYKHKTVSSD